MKGFKAEIMSALINSLDEKRIKEEIRPKKGKDYFDGAPGKNGKDGKNGRDGLDGLPGRDASPDAVASMVLHQLPQSKELSPDTIVSKVNSATRKIALKSIQGLSEEISGIKRVVRERGGGGKAGGGMGSVQHQATSTSSATTTVSTSHRIAGKGFALWVYYNGALLSRGVQYTVGTDLKTITFTFTLDDSSTVDVIYIRT